MTETTVQAGERMLRLVTAAEPRMVRGACEDCGAHAAMVTAGASRTGACSVCGSGRLTPLDEHVPPPRRWAR